MTTDEIDQELVEADSLLLENKIKHFTSFEKLSVIYSKRRSSITGSLRENISSISKSLKEYTHAQLKLIQIIDTSNFQNLQNELILMQIMVISYLTNLS